jgi:hypothetical protein
MTLHLRAKKVKIKAGDTTLKTAEKRFPDILI